MSDTVLHYIAGRKPKAPQPGLWMCSIRLWGEKTDVVMGTAKDVEEAVQAAGRLSGLGQYAACAPGSGDV